MSDAISVQPFAPVVSSINRRLSPNIILSAAIAALLLNRRRQAENFIASRYEGCSLGDTSERSLNNDIANCDWTRFY